MPKNEISENLETKKLSLVKCDSCGCSYLPPIFACHECGATKFSKMNASGKGKIYTFTVVTMTFGFWSEKTPYILAIIELKENLKVTAAIIDTNDLDSIQVNQQVQFDQYILGHQDKPAMLFKLV